MAAYFQENSVDFFLRVIGCIHSFQSMVGQTATICVEIIVANIQCLHQIVERIDVYISCNRQAIHIFVKRFGVFHHHGAVGAPGGQHRGFKRFIGDHSFVMFEIVDRIISSANHFHIGLGHQTASAELWCRKQFVAFVPSALGVGAIE